MRSLAEDRHEKALRVWRRWKRTTHKGARRRAISELAGLCEPEMWRAVGELAGRLGEKLGQVVTVRGWLRMHSWAEDDVYFASVYGVHQAAEGFDPNHPSKASFQTYAYKFVRRAVRDTAASNLVVKAGHEDAIMRVPEDESVETTEGRRDLWSLFERDSREQAELLKPLGRESLVEIRDWIDENLAVVVERFGHGCGVAYVRFFAWYLAWVKQLPPEVRHTSPFADKPKDGLPLQGAAIKVDGKTWDLALPIRAELLRQQPGYLSQGDIAKCIGMPRTSYREMKRRLDELGFTPDKKFTVDELDAIVRGKNPGRPPKHED